jgi:hypothetical protein
MHLMLVIAICLACFSGCSRTSQGLVASVCMRPAGAVVKDSHQAILLARAAWYCAHSSEHMESESAWLAKYETYNKDHVWHITRKIPDGYAGGGPVVEIAEKDGRILDMNRTQ